jgi:hypothetical protein
MQKTTTLLTTLVMVLLAARLAWAGPTEDSDREAARTAAKKATAAYNLGHYDEAATLYEEAYRLVQDPIFLYDLGQSYRQANKLDKALTAYRSYLRTAPADAPNRARVEEWVGELEWTSDVQARSSAHQQAASPAKTLAPIPPTASPPPATGIDLTTQPGPAPATPSTWKKWLPWIGVGTTAALGTAAILTGLSARSTFNGLQGSCGKTRTCTDAQVQGVNSRATVTNVLWGLAAASAVATSVAFYFNYSSSDGKGVSLAWRY